MTLPLGIDSSEYPKPVAHGRDAFIWIVVMGVYVFARHVGNELLIAMSFGVKDQTSLFPPLSAAKVFRPEAGPHSSGMLNLGSLVSRSSLTPERSCIPNRQFAMSVFLVGPNLAPVILFTCTTSHEAAVADSENDRVEE